MQLDRACTLLPKIADAAIRHKTKMMPGAMGTFSKTKNTTPQEKEQNLIFVIT